jgi:hypothetical protein
LSTDEPRRPGAVSDAGFHYAVEVQLDGNALPLKTFLHDMIGGAVMGLLSGLRDGEAQREVQIRVRRVVQASE